MVMLKQVHDAIFLSLKEYCKNNEMVYIKSNKPINPTNFKLKAPTIDMGAKLDDDMIYLAIGTCSFDESFQMDVPHTYTCTAHVKYDEYGHIYVEKIKDNSIYLREE